MSKYQGLFFLLKIKTDNAGFVTLAGQKDGSNVRGVDWIDVTDKDGSRWRKLIAGGVQTVEVDCAGYLQNVASHSLLLALAHTGQIHTFQLVFADDVIIQHDFLVRSVSGSGDYQEAQNYELSLTGASDPALGGLQLVEGGAFLLLVEGGAPLLLTED
jgi:TP901-1 family phage major tail protein